MRPLLSPVFQRHPVVLIASPMRRFCFLLLAFLFPLQLFAGALEPMANSAATADQAIVIVFGATDSASDPASDPDNADTPASAQAADDEAGADSDPRKVQADLEDQTLPVPVATLPLDWQPFPHLYPRVSGGTSAFIDLLRPPPAV
ncbi:hypothetical protein F506_09085 [Herbaspirillum hiltneri N3]|uniref:Uncharacterized protein n=2 Tax=Herbaspirillum TaxID=963 RepID=A0ABM5V6I4_9BURK|nr:hypothetical protein F506_09085 [Herbaspirillum hiltneri N3]